MEEMVLLLETLQVQEVVLLVILETEVMVMVILIHHLEMDQAAVGQAV